MVLTGCLPRLPVPLRPEQGHTGRKLPAPRHARGPRVALGRLRPAQRHTARVLRPPPGRSQERRKGYKAAIRANHHLAYPVGFPGAIQSRFRSRLNRLWKALLDLAPIHGHRMDVA